MEKRPYHHGDLRRALVEAGLQILETRNADEIGLREVARAVGVSATAVYRHFPDKEALLRALGSEGFRRLADAQAEAWKRGGGGAAGLTATGVAYVRFAQANPALFRLMFSHGSKGGPAEPDDETERSMRLLQEHAASAVGGEFGSHKARAVALRTWCLVHGLAHLVVDGKISVAEEQIDDIVDQVFAVVPAPTLD